MESRSLTSSALTLQVGSQTETQPLLSPVEVPTFRKRLAQACISPTHLCLTSKAATLILIWSGIVGATCTLATDATVAVGIALHTVEVHGHKLDNILLNVLIPYLCTALIMLLYPLGGFMADVWCGRYKSVMISLCVLACSFGCFTIGCTVVIVYNAGDINIQPVGLYTVGKYIVIVIIVTAFILYIFGLSGFLANFIQLGLDQLHEAPSEYLGLFVHWAIWASRVSAPVFHILFAAYGCTQSDQLLYGLLSLPSMCFILLLFILVFSYRKRYWFYIEPGQHNPYKMVLNTLMFAKNHKYPRQRSAFTFNDGERPTRIDFAKERYGGPFLTEQVEDVKTFLRILVVLLALGPIYILEVPTSYFIFPSFTLHTGPGLVPAIENHTCTAHWLILESGTLAYVISVIVFPVYIWLIYSLLRKCIPRIFSRLLLGEILLFVTVFSMLIIDLVGHLTFDQHGLGFDSYYGDSDNGTYCMFKIHVVPGNIRALNLPWSVHVMPSILVSFSPMLITASAFEFISAQSPHSMKGLLIGLLFAIKGLFQLSSAFLLLPFSLPQYWATKGPTEVNCAFGYLTIIIGLALISLVTFSAVTKWYQYRERDDPPYDQMAVEEVYARNISQNTYQVYSPENNMEFTNSFLIDN